MSGANQYIRQALHHIKPPPPINARFFYKSPVPIDDPLSPVPPPSTKSVLPNLPATQQLPKPFSQYDNAALDKAWHDLTRKNIHPDGGHGEKTRLRDDSQTGRTPSLARENRSSSGSRPATPRAKAGGGHRSTLSQQLDGPPDRALSATPLDGLQTHAEAPLLPSVTGTPMIRAAARDELGAARQDTAVRPNLQRDDTYEWDDSSHLAEHSPRPDGRQKESGTAAKLAVGVSRLHQVEMPGLRMTPIYWTPVMDAAQVVRGTWFYHDTMLPVETAVANMLEAGYIELQVWTDTWRDELNSAVEVGAAGEMKIVHMLWPGNMAKPSKSRPPARRGPVAPENLLRNATANLMEGEPDTPLRQREKAVEAACKIIDISTGPDGADNRAAGITLYGRQGTVRAYSSYGVIYASHREARILQPSLLPSAYFGRRPLANYIRKGHPIGIPVVRGFDQTIWDKLHPPAVSPKSAKADRGVATSDSGAPPAARRKQDPALAEAERPKVTDLVLVIHGIGQKLSERMASWHFTHAMDCFRREVNVEAGTKEVQACFRDNMGGIMVLPVNWRLSMTVDDGPPLDSTPGAAVTEFTLQDITPQTLPAVRTIVSDVMLDIPYYMSQYQPKMIGAVIRELNRVYQLWCLNNPGFADTGRVHIIGHSLGSVLALDVLSQQPTTIPERLSDPTSIDLEAAQLSHLLFNTSNLFLAGSPAGFFLLLKRAQLKPRINHPSADTDADPIFNNLSICGEQGEYGCIAVDNIYNIINGYDPVAYRMNAAVDAAYAASLKQADIPSASAGWFGRDGVASLFAGLGQASMPSGFSSKQATLTRLPSNVEMETHNFTREEAAEKRMLLLNDNGQIDYFLRHEGGPLELQYLTMLSAHSSYWQSKDFTRMIVVELGRMPGRQGTVERMRAVKKKAHAAR